MKVINWLKAHWNSHGTKVLGFAQVTVGAIAAGGIIPPNHVKYWITAGGLLTAWRGFVNSAKL